MRPYRWFMRQPKMWRYGAAFGWSMSMIFFLLAHKLIDLLIYLIT